MATNDTLANSRINNAWEKFAIWACSAIIALLAIGYQDQKSKVDKMEEKVQFLYIDKVSKQDMDKFEERIMTGIAAGNAMVLARVDLMARLPRETQSSK
jgi:hypothetical protein